MTLPERSGISTSGVNELDTPKPNMITYSYEMCDDCGGDVNGTMLEQIRFRQLGGFMI